MSRTSTSDRSVQNLPPANAGGTEVNPGPRKIPHAHLGATKLLLATQAHALSSDQRPPELDASTKATA